MSSNCGTGEKLSGFQPVLTYAFWKPGINKRLSTVCSNLFSVTLARWSSKRDPWSLAKSKAGEAYDNYQCVGVTKLQERRCPQLSTQCRTTSIDETFLTEQTRLGVTIRSKWRTDSRRDNIKPESDCIYETIYIYLETQYLRVNHFFVLFVFVILFMYAKKIRTCNKQIHWIQYIIKTIKQILEANMQS